MTHDINPVEVDRSEVCERQKLGRSEVVDSTEDDEKQSQLPGEPFLEPVQAAPPS